MTETSIEKTMIILLPPLSYSRLCNIEHVIWGFPKYNCDLNDIFLIKHTTIQELNIPVNNEINYKKGIVAIWEGENAIEKAKQLKNKLFERHPDFKEKIYFPDDKTTIDNNLNILLPVILNTENKYKFLDQKKFVVVKTIMQFHFRKHLNDSPLLQAAWNGDLDKIKELITNGAKTYETNENMDTALLNASCRGHLHVISWLLENGSSIHERNKFGNTSLLYASTCGHISVVDYLLNNGLSITDRNNNKLTILLSAADNGNLDMVKYAISKGCSLLDKDITGATSFLTSVFNRHLEVSLWLLKHGSDINDTIFRGNICIHTIAKIGDVKFLKTILNEYPIDVKRKNKVNDTILHFAAYSENIEMSKYCMELGLSVNDVDDRGYTPLLCAAERGILENIKFYKENGADITATLHNEDNAIHIAAQGGFLDIIKYLHNEGLSLDSKTNGVKALHIAAEFGHLNVIQWLHEQGQSLNEKCEYENSPIIYASFGGSKKLLQYLIDNGCSINDQNESGARPLNCAIETENIEITNFLLENGCSTSVNGDNGETVLREMMKKENIELFELVTTYIYDNDVITECLNNSSEEFKNIIKLKRKKTAKPLRK